MGDTGYLPTVLSFCSGYAGIERGLNIAGFKHRVLAYVEIEAFAIANLVQKMEQGILDSAPVYTDLKTFPAGLFRDAVDLITGGYPCQPFSHAGERRGHDDPRHLWPYISEAVGIIRPGRVFFENVEGHISLGLNEVISDLEDRGYDTTWGIFSAAEVGAPHRRKRVFIMGDTNSSEWGAATKKGDVSNGGDARQQKTASIFTTSDKNARSKFVADADRTGQRPDQGQRQTRDNIGWRSETVSDSRHGGGKRTWNDKCFWPFTFGWSPEPDVGRVANGCPDRVDRLRLLGNGVVPQTAAKAWQILDAELSEVAQ